MDTPSTPAATIIVPTFNRAPILGECLEALLNQEYPADYEVIVVDDGSSDETPALLSEWSTRHGRRMRAFRQQNSGPARARNRGAREAHGRILAFTDDDCVAEPSWLASLVQTIENAECGVAAGVMINRESTWVSRYIVKEAVIDQHLAADGSVRELITGNFGIRSDVFHREGGFDEQIKVAGGEDTEFGLRLQSNGYRIAYAPEARVLHRSHLFFRDYLRMIYRHGRGRRRLAERFGEYRITWPHLRLLWNAWPLRRWMIRDYDRYRRLGVPTAETGGYLLLRYFENIVRVCGYIRGN